jgi:hypothetical protein
MVEAAAIALALHETRPWIWERLSERERDNITRWLETFTGKRTADNNWVLFQVVTEQFVLDAGGNADPAEIERRLERIEDWYVGDGWYTDGSGQNFDYYIGWAMHLYPLMWTRMSGDDRAAVYAERLRQFLEQYQYFFGADGAPVHQGRSLTYRHATAAPLWVGELFGATPLRPGQSRRLASGIAKHFTDHGVPDDDGLLTLGWYQPFLGVTQPYSGPGSPYWAAKGFLGLLLKPDHPAWTATEEPAPNEVSDRVVAMPAPGFVLHSTRGDGIVRLLNHGSDHARDLFDGEPDKHYVKLAYSSRTGPETADNHVAVLGADGEPSSRARIERIEVTPDGARSAYSDGDTEIFSAVVAHGAWEVRVHRVGGAPGRSVREGGYAVAAARPPEAVTGAGPRAAVTRADGLTSHIAGLHGWRAAVVIRGNGTSAFGAFSATPCLTGVTGDLLVTAVLLTGDPGETAARTPAADIGRNAVEVTFPDGHAVEVALPDAHAVEVTGGLGEPGD